jgi:hypothetical protein
MEETSGVSAHCEAGGRKEGGKETKMIKGKKNEINETLNK